MKKNIAVFILIILFIAATVATIYFGSSVVTKRKKIESLEKELVESKVTYEQEIERIKKENKAILPVFQNGLIANKTEDMSVTLYPISKNGLVASLKEDGKVFVQVTSKLYFPGFEGNLYQDYEVTGLQGRAVDVQIFNQGNGINSQIIMLMEDGTVEYLNMQKIQKSLFESSGKVEGLNNVVKVVEVSVTGNEMAGYISIAAIRADGTITLFPELISMLGEDS